MTSPCAGSHSRTEPSSFVPSTTVSYHLHTTTSVPSGAADAAFECVAAVGRQTQGAGVELPGRRQRALHTHGGQGAPKRRRAIGEPPLPPFHVFQYQARRAMVLHALAAADGFTACWPDVNFRFEPEPEPRPSRCQAVKASVSKSVSNRIS
jgi:hypothetical protein